MTVLEEKLLMKDDLPKIFINTSNILVEVFTDEVKINKSKKIKAVLIENENKSSIKVFDIEKNRNEIYFEIFQNTELLFFILSKYFKDELYLYGLCFILENYNETAHRIVNKYISNLPYIECIANYVD